MSHKLLIQTVTTAFNASNVPISSTHSLVSRRTKHRLLRTRRLLSCLSMLRSPLARVQCVVLAVVEPVINIYALGRDVASRSRTKAAWRCTCVNRRARVRTHARGSDKAFPEAGRLIIHMRVHTGERPHAWPREGCGEACPYACPSEGSDMSGVEMVIRTHRGEHPHVCPWAGCGNAYSHNKGGLTLQCRVCTCGECTLFQLCLHIQPPETLQCLRHRVFST